MEEPVLLRHRTYCPYFVPNTYNVVRIGRVRSKSSCATIYSPVYQSLTRATQRPIVWNIEKDCAVTFKWKTTRAGTRQLLKNRVITSSAGDEEVLGALCDAVMVLVKGPTGGLAGGSRESQKQCNNP